MEWRKFSVVISWLIVCAPLAHAGAWPQDAGSGQVITTTYLANAKKAFDADGNTDLDAEYSKFETRAYIEYGINHKWTLVFHPSFQDVSLTTPLGPQSYSGLGQTEFSARRLLWESGRNVLSTQASVILESGGENTPEAALGEGGTDYEARLLFGRSLDTKRFRAFGEIQAARRFRNEGEPDEWRLDISGGIRPVENVQILGQVFAIKSDGARFPRRDYLSVKSQLSAVWDRPNGRSYQLGLYGTVAGENIIQERGLIASMWQTF